MGKLFGWTRYRLTAQERDDSEKALRHAEEVARLAQSIREEAERVGARQPQLRRENGFGNKLTHVFRNA